MKEYRIVYYDITNTYKGWDMFEASSLKHVKKFARLKLKRGEFAEITICKRTKKINPIIKVRG